MKSELAPLSASGQSACSKDIDTLTQTHTYLQLFPLFTIMNLHVYHPKTTCKQSEKKTRLPSQTLTGRAR